MKQPTSPHRTAPLGLIALALLSALGLAALRGWPDAAQTPALTVGSAPEDPLAPDMEPSLDRAQSATSFLAPSSPPEAAATDPAKSGLGAAPPPEKLHAAPAPSTRDATQQADPEGWRSLIYRGSAKGAPAWFRIRYPADWALDKASTAAGPSLQSIPFNPLPSQPLWARLSVQRGGRAQSLAGDPAAEAVQIGGLPALRSEQVDDWGMRQILVSIEGGGAHYSLAASLSSAAEDAEVQALGERLDAIIASFEPIAWRLDLGSFEERQMEGALADGSGLALRLPAGWQATSDAGVVRLVGELGEVGVIGEGGESAEVGDAGAVTDAGAEITIRVAEGDAADAAAWEAAEPLEYQIFRRPSRALGAEMDAGPDASSRSFLVGPGGAWRVDLSLPALAEGSEAWWLQEQTVWAVLVNADLVEAPALP